jgi:hypothetical protein
MIRTTPLLTLALCLAVSAGVSAQEEERRRVQVPTVDVGSNYLETRQRAQEATRPQFKAPIDFSFTDRVEASGITFRHESVDDSSKYWKPVHYDHGNGIVAADVDGDGRLDLYFQTQLGGNELWKNLGAGRFANVTEKAGVALADRVSVAASFADVDNDGDQDLFVTTVRMGNVLFENDGSGRFKDISAAAGLDYSGHSSGAVFFDYDLDGYLDLFLTNVGRYTFDEKGRGGAYVGMADAFEGHLYPERSERSILYRNLGASSGTLRFEDVSAATGLMDESWSGDATVVDLNGDGYQDLYVLNMQGDDHYYENQGGEKFAERTAAVFPKTSWGAMGVKFFDFDRDAALDLLVTDMHSDMGEEGFEPLAEKNKVFGVMVAGGENNIAGNSFYVRQEDGSFAERSDALGAENYWPWGISVADLNADGYEDVFLASSMNYPFRYGINSVFINDQGRTFRDAEFLLGVEPRRDGRTHAPVFDLECAGADKEHERCEGWNEPLTIVGALGTRSSIVFDLDDDGDVDIVTNEFNDGPQVLISNLAQESELKYLSIQLVGSESNRDAIGAWVEVVTDKGKLTRYQDATSGYLSHCSLPLYFGLGEATKVERVEVRWPSGRSQTVTEGLTTSGSIEIVEPSAPADQGAS